MAALQSPSPFARLCQKCKVLELDEKSLPGPALDASVPQYELALNWGLVPKTGSCDFCYLVSFIIFSWQAHRDLEHLPKHNRRVTMLSDPSKETQSSPCQYSPRYETQAQLNS